MGVQTRRIAFVAAVGIVSALAPAGIATAEASTAVEAAQVSPETTAQKPDLVELSHLDPAFKATVQRKSEQGREAFSRLSRVDKATSVRSRQIRDADAQVLLEDAALRMTAIHREAAAALSEAEVIEFYGSPEPTVAPEEVDVYLIPGEEAADSGYLTVEAGAQVNEDASITESDFHDTGMAMSGSYANMHVASSLVTVKDDGGSACGDTYADAIARSSGSRLIESDPNWDYVISEAFANLKITVGTWACMDFLNYGYAKQWSTNPYGQVRWQSTEPRTDARKNCTEWTFSISAAVASASTTLFKACDLLDVPDYINLGTWAASYDNAMFQKYVSDRYVDDDEQPVAALATFMTYPGIDSGRTYKYYVDPDNALGWAALDGQ